MYTRRCYFCGILYNYYGVLRGLQFKGIRIVCFLFLFALHIWVRETHEGHSVTLINCIRISINIDAWALGGLLLYFHIPSFAPGKYGCFVCCYGWVRPWRETLLCVRFVLYLVWKHV